MKSSAKCGDKVGMLCEVDECARGLCEQGGGRGQGTRRAGSEGGGGGGVAIRACHIAQSLQL